MAGLGILGLLHAIFVFSGDILLLYAIFGSLLWFLRDYSLQKLIKIALWMLPLSMFFLTTLAVFIDAIMSDETISFITIGGASPGGSFLEATKARIADWSITFGFLFLLQGPLAFGAFAVGLAAAKTDLFSYIILAQKGI